MDFSFNKQGLLDALEARRTWAVALDKKRAADHKAAEQAALKRWRENVRKERERLLADVKRISEAALKAPYAELRVSSGYSKPFSGRVQDMDFDDGIRWPECPKSVVQSLDQHIKFVKDDGRKHYHFRGGGHFSKIHYLLTHDENAKPDVCT